jgi:hypothetical protein
MADGQFLSELSSGIFGRLGELQKQQTSKDESRRAEVLNLLAGLSDKVEPESLPLLMGHIGEVMKLKGPMKKFWSAFSGMPDRGFEDQLGTQLSEIMGGATGPTTAANARDSYKQQLLQPFREEGSRPRSVTELTRGGPPELKGKMIFRDPRREELDKINARYEGQEQLLQDRLALTNEFRGREGELKRAHDKDMLNARFELKRGQAQSEMAGWLISTFPQKFTYDTAYQEAGRRLLGMDEAKVDQIRQRIQLMKSQGNLADVQATQAETGTKPSDIRADRTFDKAQQGEFRKLQSELSSAQARARSIDPEIRSIESELNAWAKKLVDRGQDPNKASFDPTTRRFKGASLGAEALPMVAPLFQRYNDLQKEKESVMSGRRTMYGQITNQFSDYINPTLSEEDEVTLQKEFGGVAPAGAPRTTPGQRPATPTRKGGDGGQSSRYFRSPNPEKYQVGMKYKDANGRMITVVGIGPTGEIYYK